MQQRESSEGARAASAGRQAFVSGRVQGVAFRWSTREQARELGLTGWVRNLDDGRVEVRAEGSPDELDRLMRWLNRGPSAARVERVAVQDVAPSGFPEFTVEPDAPA